MFLAVYECGFCSVCDPSRLCGKLHRVMIRALAQWETNNLAHTSKNDKIVKKKCVLSDAIHIMINLYWTDICGTGCSRTLRDKTQM
jgi:hypothetical protein